MIKTLLEPHEIHDFVPMGVRVVGEYIAIGFDYAKTLVLRYDDYGDGPAYYPVKQEHLDTYISKKIQRQLFIECNENLTQKAETDE